jgi:malate synthase
MGCDLKLVAGLENTYESILTPDAMGFLSALSNKFDADVDALLGRRADRQKKLDSGEFPDFLSETADIRQSEWKVAEIPPALRDRRVEITGPVDRKMVINALNSGANTYMADFEDSSSPTWSVMMDGQVNLRDAVSGTISFTNDSGKEYRLNSETSVLLVRPRGWHLKEKHLDFGGKAPSAALVDFGLFLFHNAEKLLAQGVGPYFYLPKMESHLEARLWNEVFNFSQDYLGIPRGSIRATVLIETTPAAFEMDEILWELRDHSAGLNCGRWDYIFSFIKCFRNHPDFVLPNRSEVGMTEHFLSSYSQLLIKTCHRRGIHAMGGMAAQIPIKNDEDANNIAFEKVRSDKEREAKNGHDGTWVAHPGLIPVAKDVFDACMPNDNQIDKTRSDVAVSQSDLLRVPVGTISIDGLEANITAALHYTEQWISGLGCVPLNNLMEDAATAEISRAQIWQWIHHEKGVTNDGQKINEDLFMSLLNDELVKIKTALGDSYRNARFTEAAELIARIVTDEQLADFLTLEAYSLI